MRDGFRIQSPKPQALKLSRHRNSAGIGITESHTTPHPDAVTSKNVRAIVFLSMQRHRVCTSASHPPMQSCYVYRSLPAMPKNPYHTRSEPCHAERSNALNPLHHHRRRCSPTITNSGNTVLARLELMQQRRQDPRAGAAERVAE